jgi:ATP-dependent Zn protease
MITSSERTNFDFQIYFLPRENDRLKMEGLDSSTCWRVIEINKPNKKGMVVVVVVVMMVMMMITLMMMMMRRRRRRRRRPIISVYNYP